MTVASSATSVKSDNSDSVTITATALNSSNAAVSGVAVTFSASTGVISASSASTDATGQAKVTFSAGADPTNRTATITVTSGTITKQVPVAIAGSTIDLSANSTALTVGGSLATLTATLKNAGGTPIANTPVTFASTGSTPLTVTPTTGTTNAAGQVAVQVSGSTAGTGTVTATSSGFSRTVDFGVTGATTFGITSTVPASVNKVASLLLAPDASLRVNVTAPTGTGVVFVSTSGTWSYGSSPGAGQSTVIAAGNSATNVLTVTAAGVVTVQVYNAASPGTTDLVTASVTSAVANATKITLQSSPTVVSPSTGGSGGVSTLIATVTDANNQPVGGATVAFQIVNATGGGETIAPAVAQTLTAASGTQALGQAKATFTAGSLPSGASGVQIKATVVEVPSVFTGNGTSGANATVVIGGTAGSVTIGRATVIQDAGNSTAYILPMSVLVADANGNPVASATVSLSAWPIAWAPGNACSPGNYYYNEDANEDLVLDLNNEDGVRYDYVVPKPATFAIGSKDGQATPPNSASGTLPATVTTDASGLATFNLTYTKSNALFIKARIKASTRVQGTETVGQTVFTLPALLTDIGPPCLLPASPYTF